VGEGGVIADPRGQVGGEGGQGIGRKVLGYGTRSGVDVDEVVVACGDSEDEEQVTGADGVGLREPFDGHGAGGVAERGRGGGERAFGDDRRGGVRAAIELAEEACPGIARFALGAGAGVVSREVVQRDAFGEGYGEAALASIEVGRSADGGGGCLGRGRGGGAAAGGDEGAEEEGRGARAAGHGDGERYTNAPEARRTTPL
jgi:hypothetical protein